MAGWVVPSFHYLVYCGKIKKKKVPVDRWAVWDSVKRNFVIDNVSKKKLLTWAEKFYKLDNPSCLVYRRRIKLSIKYLLANKIKDPYEFVNHKGVILQHSELKRRIIEDKVHALVRDMTEEDLEKLLETLTK